jgi:hypothetical protein
MSGDINKTVSATTATGKHQTTKRTHQPSPLFYKLNAAELPDSLFRPEVSPNDWIGGCDGVDDEHCGNDANNKLKQRKRPWMEITSDPNGFPQGSLSRIVPLEPLVDLERSFGIPVFMMANVSPILIPLALLMWKAFRVEYAKHLAVGVGIYHATLLGIWRIFLVPLSERRTNTRYNESLDPNDAWKSQYLFPARNVTKYCSISYVWPSSLQQPTLAKKAPSNSLDNDRPIIFCMIPHGLAPYGITGYPYFSKLWNNKSNNNNNTTPTTNTTNHHHHHHHHHHHNSRLCSWVCAPILLKLPWVGLYHKAIGYIPAKSRDILKALTQQDRNVGIVLDGIDGMFYTTTGSSSSSSCSSNHIDQEVGTILDRKGICKIALKANATLVPVYCFGHTKLYDVVVDPFGILKWLSSKLHMSIVPFFGRWGWFLGPPKRSAPVCVCLGDPIPPPPKANDANNTDDDDDHDHDETETKTKIIAQQDIDEHHARLLEGFRSVFETHKRGYYGDVIGSKKQLVFCR